MECCLYLTNFTSNSGDELVSPLLLSRWGFWKARVFLIILTWSHFVYCIIKCMHMSVLTPFLAAKNALKTWWISTIVEHLIFCSCILIDAKCSTDPVIVCDLQTLEGNSIIIFLFLRHFPVAGRVARDCEIIVSSEGLAKFWALFLKRKKKKGKVKYIHTYIHTLPEMPAFLYWSSSFLSSSSWCY